MKKVAVVMPTAWDRDQLARPAVARAYELCIFGAELFEDLPSILTSDFDLDRFCTETAEAAGAWGADGIIGTLDYPAALIAAEVAARLSLPSPSLRSLLELSHKFRSRQLQQAAVPEAVPPFWLVELAHPQVPDQYPLFIKPVKGTLSAWAREVANREELVHALTFSPLEGQLFSRAMLPMNLLLRRFPELGLHANCFIAEGVLTGDLFTLEGYVHRGRLGLLGVVDSIFFPGTRSFERFGYPSRLPSAVQERMWSWSERVIKAAGFDAGVFDLEFSYDEACDRLAIIEVNPRLCPQFSDLYEKVDGRSSYDLLLELATGQAPSPVGKGHSAIAASCVLRTFTDAVVKRLPTPADLAALAERFPEVRIVLLAKEGEPLSLQLQDPGSFRYGVVNLGAPSREHLDSALTAIKAALGIVLEAR